MDVIDWRKCFCRKTFTGTDGFYCHSKITGHNLGVLFCSCGEKFGDVATLQSHGVSAGHKLRCSCGEPFDKYVSFFRHRLSTGHELSGSKTLKAQQDARPGWHEYVESDPFSVRGVAIGVLRCPCGDDFAPTSEGHKALTAHCAATGHRIQCPCGTKFTKFWKGIRHFELVRCGHELDELEIVDPPFSAVSCHSNTQSGHLGKDRSRSPPREPPRIPPSCKPHWDGYVLPHQQLPVIRPSRAAKLDYLEPRS